MRICERPIYRPPPGLTGFNKELLVQLPIDTIDTIQRIAAWSPYTGIDVDDVVDAVSELEDVPCRLASLAVDYEQIVANCRIYTWNGKIARVAPETIYELGEFIQAELDSLQMYEFGKLNYYCENTFRNYLLLVRMHTRLDD